MRSLTLLAFLLSPILAIAHQFPPWIPPSETDVRSPCPGLNTLANHNLLPHSGRNLSIPMLQKALGITYNIGLDISTVFAIGGLFASPKPIGGTFDLSDLKRHNFIEHDASLSRADVALSGDAVTFQREIWGRVLETYRALGLSNTTIEAAATARASRIADAKMQNADIDFGMKQKIMSLGETALYLSAMGGVNTGVTPVEWVDIWFCELPI